MFCPECGSKNPDTARFCYKCGYEVGKVNENTNKLEKKPKISIPEVDIPPPPQVNTSSST